MLTLAIESSAKAASVCLCRDGERIAQSDQRSGLTHSRTLLPMIESMFAHTEIRPEEIPGMIGSKDRKNAGPTAPPQGLCMMKVDY